MRIKSFGISLAVVTALSLGFTGCGDSESDDSRTSDTGSGILTEVSEGHL